MNCDGFGTLFDGFGTLCQVCQGVPSVPRCAKTVKDWSKTVLLLSIQSNMIPIIFHENSRNLTHYYSIFQNEFHTSQVFQNKSNNHQRDLTTNQFL